MKTSFELDLLDRHSRLDYLYDVAYRDGTVFAVGDVYSPAVLASTDGTDFRALPFEVDTRPGLRSVHIDQDQRVIVVGNDGRVFVSSDAGATWSRRETGTRACLYAVAPDATGRLWACGDKGVVLSSDDRGDTWTLRRQGGPRLLGIFAHGDRVFFYGLRVLAYDGDALIEDLFVAKSWLCDMVATASGELLVVGDKGTVLRGSARGDQWRPVATTAGKRNIDGAAVLDGGLLLLVGQGGLMLASEDDGATFERVASDLGEDLAAIAPCPGGAFIVGEEGRLVRLWLPGGDDPFQAAAAPPPESVSDAPAPEPPPSAPAGSTEALLQALQRLYEAATDSGYAAPAGDIYFDSTSMTWAFAEGEEVALLEAALEVIDRLYALDDSPYGEPGDEEHEALEAIALHCRARLPIPTTAAPESREAAIEILSRLEVVLLGVSERGAAGEPERRWLDLVVPAITLLLEDFDPDDWYPHVLAERAHDTLERLPTSLATGVLREIDEALTRLTSRYDAG